MESGESTVADQRVITYCLVPSELAPKLHEPLRKHFADQPLVEVVVERRGGDRRLPADRRDTAEAAPPEQEDRRRIRSQSGRRVADRRAAQVAVAAQADLPRRARAYADRLTFVQVLEPTSEQLADQDTARVVTRIQAGASEEFATLYLRYFDRVYAYLKLAFNDEHAAEDSTQQVFVKVIEALPRYERRKQPFRAWLFTIVRNHAISQLERRARVDLVDPVQLAESREGVEQAEPAGMEALSWITDRELLMLVERLPEAQRQVLVLRFMLDLGTAEIALILGRSNDDVRALQSRALRFLKERLGALGRGSLSARRSPMRRRRVAPPVLAARRFQTVP